MLLEQGQIVEFDKWGHFTAVDVFFLTIFIRPSTLLSDPSTRFYGLCKATGQDEFATLKKLAGVWATFISTKSSLRIAIKNFMSSKLNHKQL